jgi:hypothetical protein
MCSLEGDANASPPTKKNNWNERQNIIMKIDHNARTNMVWVMQMFDLHIQKWIPKEEYSSKEVVHAFLAFDLTP